MCLSSAFIEYYQSLLPYYMFNAPQYKDVDSGLISTIVLVLDSPAVRQAHSIYTE